METFKSLLDFFEDIPETAIVEITSAILFREKEKEFILNFLGPKNSIPYPSLFIYGHTATGKTYLMSKLLKDLSLPHAWIDCHEAYTSKLMFNSILQQLSQSPDHQIKNYSICDFVNCIKKFLKHVQETTYIVFDSAEVLRKEDSSVLATFIKLQELTKTNVCTIFISKLPWIKFINSLNAFKPISIHFPNYSKDEISDILMLSCPDEYSKNFYSGYINIILKVFFTVTRNLRELKHIADINFEKYCEPLKEEPDIELSNMRLWKHIEPTLKEAMNSVYLREISGTKWRNFCKPNDDSQSSAKIVSSLSVAKYNITRELPFYSKFLLVAAYFASYNLPKTDIKHFVKNQGKQRKKRMSKKPQKNLHLLGPRAFALDRMLSIFFSIVGERVLPSAILFSQISSLVSMGLLLNVSGEDKLDCPKFKCLAELDVVDKIAKTINIDVMGYLDDFL